MGFKFVITGLNKSCIFFVFSHSNQPQITKNNIYQNTESIKNSRFLFTTFSYQSFQIHLSITNLVNKYIIIAMDDLSKLAFTITSEKNRLPQLSERSTLTIDKEAIKKQHFDKRLQQLQGSIRLLQKKYKQNLKQGFEDKIKSFRLKAVMQRKVIKSTIEQTKRQIQQEQIRQKTKRTKQQKQKQQLRMRSINERIQNKRKRIISNTQKEKQEVKEKIREQQYKQSLLNRQIHDKITQQLRNTDKKKIYFDLLRKAQKSQQVERQKKQYIEKILENKQTLDKLKLELQFISNESKVKTKDNISNMHPFVTI